MKFKSIMLENFMRFKGKNIIEFSVDDNKNVTVVLGDNTFGKTTLAQAFRWGLYGSLMVEQGKIPEDYKLINNNVVDSLENNSVANVCVDITFLFEDNEYELHREIQYLKRNHSNKLIPQNKILELKKYCKISKEYESIDIKKIDSVINEIMPYDLSHYFLFDGEKWNDIAISGIKENIKNSVYKITGLTSCKKAMEHLKDLGSSSVLGRFKKNIKGNGKEFINLKDEKVKLEKIIVFEEKNIKSNSIKKEDISSEIIKLEKFFELNRDVEYIQKHLKYQHNIIDERKKSIERADKNLVNDFSYELYTYFAKPMIEECEEILKRSNIERRDIPYIRQSTIDYLIERKECICGSKIEQQSDIFKHLMEQKNFLPPADIGSLLGEFEKIGRQWKKKSKEAYERVVESAKILSNVIREYDDAVIEFNAIEKGLDKFIDFAEKRKKIKKHQEKIIYYNSMIMQSEYKICEIKKKIDYIETEMKSLEEKNKENEKWNERIEVVEEIYQRFSGEYNSHKRKVFDEINKLLNQNFSIMFNAKDKKIEIDENYNIKLMFKNKSGQYIEERNLSEGEKVVRNFSFIVCIMEYVRNSKGDLIVSNEAMPIVLDGPFSKLSAENIGLIATKLPEISEQVIVFTLTKDWKYTHLTYKIGRQYKIVKDINEGFASIMEVSNENL